MNDYILNRVSEMASDRLLQVKAEIHRELKDIIEARTNFSDEVEIGGAALSFKVLGIQAKQQAIAKVTKDIKPAGIFKKGKLRKSKLAQMRIEHDFKLAEIQNAKQN